MRHCSRIIIN